MIKELVKIDGTTNILEPIVCCIGYFDGIHLGHRQLTSKAIEIAKIKGIKSCFITFLRDPVDFIRHQKTKHIQLLDEKDLMAEELGFDYFFVLDFDERMMNLSIEDFHNRVLNTYNIDTLICGTDYHYGFKGAGDYKTLACNKFEVIAIDLYKDHDEKISTTRIKKTLDVGDIKTVNALLGYNYKLLGKVVEGKKIGRTINFPTANLHINDEKYLPKVGVYNGYFPYDGKKYKCIINIGHATIKDDPTFIEVHISGFNKDIYGENVIVEFHDFIRDKLTFKDRFELQDQLAKDIKTLDTYE